MRQRKAIFSRIAVSKSSELSIGEPSNDAEAGWVTNAPGNAERTSSATTELLDIPSDLVGFNLKPTELASLILAMSLNSLSTDPTIVMSSE